MSSYLFPPLFLTFQSFLMIDSNKTAIENHLLNSTKSLLGLSSSATPDDAFKKLKSLISSAQSTANGRAQCQVVSYTGTGTYGSSNASSITFSFTPNIIFFIMDSIHGQINVIESERYRTQVPFGQVPTSYTKNYGFCYNLNAPNYASVYAKRSGNRLYWYIETQDGDDSGKINQLNRSGTTYYFVGIG